MNLALMKFHKLFNFPKTNKDLQKLFYNMKLDLFIFKTTSNPKKILNGSYPYLANYLKHNNQENASKISITIKKIFD